MRVFTFVELSCTLRCYCQTMSTSLKRKPCLIVMILLPHPLLLSCMAPKSDSVPPAKKLHLRGDWSDTGPKARPEVDSKGGGGRGRERGHLMNRNYVHDG